MTTPLILQIQAAAMDSNASVTDALRQAKVACVKLGLAEFGKWIDSELTGYKTMENFPEYRKLSGIPEGYNPYYGWHPVIFATAQQSVNYPYAHIGMSIAAIEDSIKRAKADGAFSFPYPPDVEQDLRVAVADDGAHFRIKLDVSQCGAILHVVRDILLTWTLDMEAQGIRGDDLMFSTDDKKKSEALTAHTVTNISIGQVGSFVQQATRSVVQGSVESTTTTNLSKSTLDLVQQVEALLPASNLSAPVQAETVVALDELKRAANAVDSRGIQALLFAPPRLGREPAQVRQIRGGDGAIEE